MKKAIIHIGGHKTGTTAIQMWLKENSHNLKQYGILYPTELTGASDWASGQHSIVHWLLGNRSFSEKIKSVPGSPLDYLESQFGLYDLILSSEEFCKLLPNQIAPLQTLLTKYDIKLILYVRRQDEAMQALYQTNVFNQNYAKSFENYFDEYKQFFDYANVIEQWKSIFPSAEVIVRVYEKDILKNGNSIDDFIFLLENITNQKFDKSDITYIAGEPNFGYPDYIVNLLYSFYNNPNQYELIDITKKISKLLYSEKHGNYQIVSPTKRQQILDYFSKSNALVSRVYLKNNHDNLFPNLLIKQSQQEWENKFGSFEKNLLLLFQDIGKKLGITPLQKKQTDFAIDDKQADVLRDKAMIFIREGNWESALENLKSAYSIRPNGPYIRLQLINALVQLNRFEEIIPHLHFLNNPPSCFAHDSLERQLFKKLLITVEVNRRKQEGLNAKQNGKIKLLSKKLVFPATSYSSCGSSLKGYNYPIDSNISKLIIKSEQIHVLKLEEVVILGRGYVMEKNAWIPLFDYEGIEFFPSYVRKYFYSGECYCGIYGILKRKLKPIKVDIVATVIHFNCQVYGHFLLEVLPKLFILKDFFKLESSPPSLALPINLKDWLKNYILEIWGDWNIVWFNPNEEYICAKQVLVVSGDNLYFSPEIARRFFSFAEQNNTQSPQKIFLSRPKGHHSRRTLANFENLAAIALEKGYKIIDPATLGSLKAQANLFNKSPIVLGEFTSALHNTMFSPAGTYIGCLNYLPGIQSFIAAVQGHNLNYLLSEDGPVAWNADKSFIISEIKFSKLIDDIENALNI